MNLLSRSPKTAKSTLEHPEWDNLILYMRPGKLVCRWASNGCLKACLTSAGMGCFPNVKEARESRSKLYLEHRPAFYTKLAFELAGNLKRCRRQGKRLAARLNGTSDLDHRSAVEGFPEIQFYDYTASYERMLAFLRGELPKNYHLVFSRKENNESACLDVLARGGTVSVVFDTPMDGVLPASWQGYPVQDGRKHDLTFMSTGGVWGLSALGKAKKDTSGFVVKGEK